ncbi:hypothetical protein J2W24_006377 [Variovorax boronicumulans]|uniref:hypothetical protein n=1 Tax=Variovorax boronicumulans TaxID=436515 RepID=UPI0027882692|nr:hypothetical protein [Variovorax boronicumulans]MDP9920695.1 hypothetical protein [Variovorax boronicumulans]
MTQRIHSPARPDAPRRTLKARNEALRASANVAPRAAMARVWSAGYMTVSLLAIAAACAVAGGETAKAELRFATVALHAAPLPQDICSAGSSRYVGPMEQACASAAAHGSDSPGAC